MRFDIVTFGSALIDAFVNTDIPEKKKKISYPVGSKILIKDLRFDWGGGGTNTAVAFSRFGLKTGFIGKVGKDANGEKILKSLKKEKIKFLGKQEKGKTGYSVVLDSKEHNRTILTYKGLNNKVKAKDIKKFKTNWLYYTSLLGDSLKTQKKLAKKLKKKGVKLAFNPSEYLIKAENLKSLLKMTDILVLNKEEAELLADKKGKVDKLLKALYNLGPKIVVITNKNKLVKCYNGEKVYSEKPHKIKVVERTGAGDAFASAFVAGIIRGKSIKESMKLGIKESESVIRYFGTKNKLLRRKL